MGRAFSRYNSRMAAGYVRPAGRLDVMTALAALSLARGTTASPRICLRRAGFSGTPDEIARLAAMTSARCGRVVDPLRRHVRTGAAAERDARIRTIAPIAMMNKGLDDAAKRDAAQARRKDAVADIVALQLWWLNRMLTTPAPLQEKMTFVLARALHDRRDRKRRLAESRARAESALPPVRARQSARPDARASAKIRRCCSISITPRTTSRIPTKTTRAS